MLTVQNIAQQQSCGVKRESVPWLEGLKRTVSKESSLELTTFNISYNC